MKESIHTWSISTGECIASDFGEGVTRGSLRLLEKNKGSLSRLRFIELMMPYGVEGSSSLIRWIDWRGYYIETSGLTWGYAGEGPRGLRDAIQLFRLPNDLDRISNWHDEHFTIMLHGERWSHDGCYCPLEEKI